MSDTVTITPERSSNLRKWNIGLTVLHGAQALLILFLAGDFAITVTSTFPQGPPGTRHDTPGSLFDLPIGPAVAVFLLMAAVDHLLTATVPAAPTRPTSRGASTGSAGWSTRSAPRSCSSSSVPTRASRTSPRYSR